MPSLPSSKLLHAAVSISAILTSQSIPHALIGGLALLLHSSTPYRNTKDVDFLVSASKSTIISLLSYDPSTWILIPQARDDYVAYFWKCAETDDLVLVELFTDSENKRHELPRTVKHWTTYASFPIPLLHPAALLKGKLSACASRRKQSDMFDVLFLCTNFPEAAKAGTKKCEKTMALACRQWPQLTMVLERAGVKLSEKKREMLFGKSGQLGDFQLGIEARIPVGGVQRGLGCAW